MTNGNPCGQVICDMRLTGIAEMKNMRTRRMRKSPLPFILMQITSLTSTNYNTPIISNLPEPVTEPLINEFEFTRMYRW